MKQIKYKSIIQACYREKLHKKNGTSPKRKHLDEVEIIRIRELRSAGNTLQYIADIFNRSIRTIEKHTKDIIVSFVDFNKKMWKWGNKKNHNTSNHIWKKI